MLRFLLAFVLLALAVPSMVFAATEHCPNHEGNPDKVQSKVDGDLDNIVLDAGTLFCVKGSTDASGILEADGTTSLVDYLDNGHNVSYYVTYEEAPESTPTPTPSTSAVATPTPSVAPTTTPTPSATPTTPGSPTPTPATPTVRRPVPTVSVPTIPDTAMEKATDTAVATDKRDGR